MDFILVFSREFVEWELCDLKISFQDFTATDFCSVLLYFGCLGLSSDEGVGVVTVVLVEWAEPVILKKIALDNWTF